MMIGARTAAWAKAGGGVPTARDYVKDGLIAMWDGIENAGWGVHKNQVSIIKDLSGNGNDLVYTGESVLIGDDYFENEDSQYFHSSALAPSRFSCIEIVFERLRSAVLVLRESVGSYNTNCDREIIFETNQIGLCSGGKSSNGIGVNHDFAVGSVKSVSVEYSGLNGLSSCHINGVIQTINNNTNSYWCANPFGIFALGAFFSGSNASIFKVKIKTARLYSSPISSDERAANYAIDKARFNLT